MKPWQRHTFAALGLAGAMIAVYWPATAPTGARETTEVAAMARRVNSGTTRPAVEVEGNEGIHTQHVVVRKGVAAEWSATGTGSDAETLVLTKAAPDAGQIHYVTGVDIGLSASAGDTASGIAELKSGETTLWKMPIGVGAGGTATLPREFVTPIQCGAAEAVTLSVSATGTGGCVTYANLFGYTRAE